ncbi:MAG TPA: molybdopterin cofactor-binding domain-containing protein [Reyranella sp.]|nr:molybdopterin cofactor-binding domain-containing protein [Reyranella sp.]
MTIHQRSLRRRNFLVSGAAVAGGFSLGMRLPLGEAQAAEVEEINAWVVIHPDDKVVIRIARSEMGQGTLTGLAQLVAEELECDWSKVTTEYPTPGENLRRGRVWKDFSTGGSRGIRTSHQYVREGGAMAREMLIAAAAAEWKVPAAECTAANSFVTHKSGKKLGYGHLAAAAAKIDPPKEVKLKDPKDWKLVGKPIHRLDTMPKITGKEIYGIDMKLPGMLTAAVKACPVIGGKLKSFDAAKVEKMPGVKKVVSIDNNAVVVIADTYWSARTALASLPVEWDVGKLGDVQQSDITAMLKEGLGATEAFVGNQVGDAQAAIDGAAKKVESTYAFPWQNHAPMEPLNATALYTTDKCEVWCGTQNGEAALAATAEAAELPVAKCDVHKLMLGGGFGRRGRADYVRQAVLVAKQMPGTPIKLLWSREEDMTHGNYHPTTMCKLTGGLDKDGNLVGLHVRISGQSILAGLAPQNLQNGKDPATFQGLAAGGPDAAYGYNVPNLLIDHAMRNPHVTPGFWRGVNVNQNAVYMECFMDELAEAAGKDPLEFRLKLLKPKYAAVLKAACDKAGYGKKLPEGHYHGISQVMGYGSYVAGVAEVSVSADGVMKMHKITAATNPGHAVNPWLIERQIAGSFVYGLSAALYGEITIKDGAVEQTNFDSYNVLRIDEMPQVEAAIVPTGDFWGGVGEPTIAVAAPAVLNAIYKATGKRVRELPLMNHELKKGA